MWNSFPLHPTVDSIKIPGLEMFGQNLIVPSGEILTTDAKTSFDGCILSPESAGITQVNLALCGRSDVGKQTSQQEIF